MGVADRASGRGEDIVIAKRGKPILRLASIPAAKKEPRKPARALKIEWIAPDCDGPLSSELLKLFGYDH